MTRLGRAVTERLRGAVSEQDVEAILLDARVSTSAATPTPVRLRVTEVTFSGVKRLERPADDGSEVVAAAEPFDFSWTLGSGLHVVGSHENLRGKSSVLEVIRWALRGRSRLQEDVHSWLERVRVTFQVGQDRLIVDFTLRDGQPHGAVHRDAGGDLVELIRFDSEDAFEQAMDAVMMPRLQLQRIAAWQDEQAIENAWVAYAGALSISSRGLEYLLGDVKWSGMPSRLLSMLVGAAWAASRFEAATAVKATEAALARLQRQADEREEASAGRRAEAASAVEAARTALAALPDGGERLQQIEAAVSRVGVLGAEVAALRVRLDDLRGAEQDVRRQLQEERSRKHALLEDALGRRFFSALRPTACPRCAAPVTDDRRAQEAQGHVCSMCTAGLDLDAFDHQVLVATSAPDTERQAALRSASLTETPDGEEDEAEGEEALQRALQEATARADRVEAELHARSGDREQAAAQAGCGTRPGTRPGGAGCAPGGTDSGRERRATGAGGPAHRAAGGREGDLRVGAG